MIQQENGVGKLEKKELNKEKVSKKEKKKLPNWVLGVIIGVIVLIAVVGTLLTKGGGAAKTAGGTSMHVVQAQKGDVKEVLNASGMIQSDLVQIVYSPVNATVQESLLKSGQPVSKGAKLITFDVTDLEKNNTESQLNKKSTEYTNQATIDSTNQSNSQAATAANKANQQAANSYNIAVNQYNAVANTIPQLQAAANAEEQSNAVTVQTLAQMQPQLDELDAKIKEKTAEKEVIQRNLDNYQAYQDDGGLETQAQLLSRVNALTQEITVTLPNERSVLEEQMSQYAVATSAQEALAAANAQLTELKNQVDSLGANLNSASADTTGLTQGQLGSMEVSEQLAELSAMTAAQLVEKGKEGISADFDGVVSEVQVQKGTMVTQGSPLFTLSSNTQVSVKMEVSTNDYDKLEKGKKADIKLGNKNYTGTVSEIDKIASTNEKGNSVIYAYIKIDNPDADVCIGVSAKVTLTAAEVKGAVTVPSEVINISSEGEFVYQIKDGKIVKVPVSVGVTSDNIVEIADGLKIGDEVVSEAGMDITEGMTATAITETE
ncbi:MAG: efflux RND transporter periplasmic adaptor subunit [Lachnospiraceae bacterium]|nr:efflux RND transporter periplasmic adaptor subunit [Lachnospiraceae bacterium]MDD3616280.1 efflux RND transporter periplasmic adaptor subunit [Lachnospiraceae bacterium]